MTAAKRERLETELARLVVRNMAAVMEREQVRRGLNKVEFAKLCGITAPSYISILEGKANPTMFMVARISWNTGLTLHHLIHGDDKTPNPS